MFDAPATPIVRQGDLSELLSRVAAELGSLAATAAGLETIVGELMAKNAGDNRLEEAQAMDHLVQSLSGLADFVSALGPELVEPATVNLAPAAATLRLGDLTRRLLGEQPGGNGSTHACSGDLELL